MTLFEEADRSGHEGRAASIGKPCNAVGSFMAREDLRGCGEGSWEVAKVMKWN